MNLFEFLWKVSLTAIKPASKKLWLIELIALIYPKKSLLEVNHGLLLVPFVYRQLVLHYRRLRLLLIPSLVTEGKQNLQQRSTHQRGWFAHAWESFPSGQSLHSFALVTQRLSFSPQNRLPWRTVISKVACPEQNLRFLLTFKITFYD